MNKIVKSFVLMSLSLIMTLGLADNRALAAPQQRILTLHNLKNGTYLVPDLACGYTRVTLTDGKGETDGVKVVFGQAVFGTLSSSKNPMAVVHVAYHTDELGWLQELVFMQVQGHKLTQVAEYVLDDSCTLSQLNIKNGDCFVQTA